MSERSSSSSSSASRKTSLSSTRRRRIGSATRKRLFGGEEELVVRLAARLHLDLEIGMALANAPEEAVELGRAGAGEEGEDAARLAQEALDDGVRDLVELGAACHGLV